MENLTSIFNNSKLKKAVMGILFGFGILFDVLLLSSRVTSTAESIFKSATLWIDGSNYIPAICFIITLIGVACIISAAVGIITALTTKSSPSALQLIAGLAAHIAAVILGSSFGVLGGNGMIWAILYIIFAAIGTVFALLCHRADPERKNREPAGTRKRLMLAAGIASTLMTFVLFFVPLCTHTAEDGTVSSIVPLGTVSSGDILSLIIFAALFIGATVSFVTLLGSFKAYSWPDGEYGKKIKSVVVLNTAISAIYLVAGVVFCSIKNSAGEPYTTAAYIPFLISAAIALAHAFLIRGTVPYEPFEQTGDARAARIEFLIYGGLVSIATAISVLSDIISIKFSTDHVDTVTLNGYDIFMTYNSLESGFQLVAFLLIAILTTVICLFLASVISFVCKSRLFYKITLFEILAGAISSLLIGMFGKYYEVVQKLNDDIIRGLIEKLTGIEVDNFDLVYKVTGQSFFWFIVVMFIVVVALMRKPYSRGTTAEMLVATLPATTLDNGEEEKEEKKEEPKAEPKPEPVREATETSAPKKRDNDPCPAFTELDGRTEEYKWALAERMAFPFKSPTLPELVQFVVNYARDSRLHLSYTPEDIATFVAGLGATRLTILQGMSGTGKTSLPKIFTEAVMGNCEIIEVESSWRDKNELLGYYNEFSRTYTPKKFTQALYKARLNPETLTFIVLDEMNLSRIEYYFSDFLSLMENEEDKREIKLLGVPLKRTENGETYTYSGLNDGHTVKIPPNIWFIGTANRDESTFEISDKVYDRAHTMNFNKRAPKVVSFGEPIPKRFLSAEALIALLEEAKNTVRFNIESSTVIKEVEELLQPYNISFGNRIANQIESFVSIYCACFPASESARDDAIERILLSKVVSKLEFKSVENKEQLAAEFERRRLYRCSEFILKLGED